jgi:ketosteroid isomerase-like protein
MKNRNSSSAGQAFGLCVVIALGLFGAACGDKTDDNKSAKGAIRQQIEKYTAALNAAGAGLAAQVWRNSADVSLIHPAGHAHGWEEVKGVYGFFGSAFSERKLTVRDVAIHVNGETAWAEFYWHFVAKQIKDGSPVETDGRESQIYEKTGNAWQLVHVHYSGPPMTPQ